MKSPISTKGYGLLNSKTSKSSCRSSYAMLVKRHSKTVFTSAKPNFENAFLANHTAIAENFTFNWVTRHFNEYKKSLRLENITKKINKYLPYKHD